MLFLARIKTMEEFVPRDIARLIIEFAVELETAEKKSLAVKHIKYGYIPECRLGLNPCYLGFSDFVQLVQQQPWFSFFLGDNFKLSMVHLGTIVTAVVSELYRTLPNTGMITPWGYQYDKCWSVFSVSTQNFDESEWPIYHAEVRFYKGRSEVWL